MDAEEKVSKQIEDIQALAKEHKGIDAASLMMNALAQAQQEETDKRKKRRAYLVSIVAPPLGLFFAAYYAFSGKPDGKRIAVNCAILTAVSLFLAWAVAQMFLASVPPDMTSQMQAVNADDVRRLLE